LNKTFKKIALVIGVIVLFGVLGLAGCAKQTEAIKIGATEVPHAEILEFAQPLLEEEGVEIEIVVFSDYVQPNLQLADKQLDANFFQHIPYLENMVEERGLDLTWVAKIHIEPLGIYSEKIDSLSQLEDGAQVGIPNDATNGGRALMLLEKAGLITLKEGTDVLATIYDIEDNPKNLQFHELEAAMLPRVLPDLDIAVINGNFALQAGLSPTKDALFLEGGDSPYANVIAVRTEDKDNEAIKKLVKVLTGPEVKQFIEETYEGGVIPAF
jgi:D-methionine transport system substrate-binding protein